jgi:hypothetical protein
MNMVKNIIRHWLPLALLTFAFCGLVYLVMQQSFRISANDPQIQMAEDIASAMAGGTAPASLVPAGDIDIASSLSPFVVVFDETGTVLASSGLLHGKNLALPAGVLDYVKANGEDRLTLQPEPGVRIAAVIAPVTGAKPGFVLVGRSLRETENRIDQLGLLVVATLAVTLVASLVIVALVEIVLKKT